MNIRFSLLFFLSLLSGCLDVIDQNEIKIEKDIYALHSAGIDGYSIAKKVSNSGFNVIIDASVAAVNYDDSFSNLIAKRVEKLSSVDTIYLHCSISTAKIDTISFDQFYSLKLKYNNERVLLPPKE